MYRRAFRVTGLFESAVIQALCVTVDEEKVTADVRFTPLTLSDLLENRTARHSSERSSTQAGNMEMMSMQCFISQRSSN